MTVRRVLLGAATVLTAVLLQLTVVARLPLPGAGPDLVLVLVLAFGLRDGPAAGMVTGFLAGLLADLLTDHASGRLALAYVVAGLVAGSVAGPLSGSASRSTLLPLAGLACGAVAALATYAAEGMLLGDPRTSLAAAARALTSSVPYDLLLAPFVVPPVAVLLRQLRLERAVR